MNRRKFIITSLGTLISFVVLYYYKVYNSSACNNGDLIFLVSPNMKDEYYRDIMNLIINFQLNFLSNVKEGDKAYIIVDPETYSKLSSFAKYKGNVVKEYIGDIWIRDFAPVVVKDRLYLFKYMPSYLNANDAIWIQRSLKKWLDNLHIEYNEVDLILDGGNFVYDGVNKLILTTRVFKDNRDKSEREILSILENIDNIDEVAVIPEEPDDVTGHADGMVLWLSPDTLLVNKYSGIFRDKVLNILRETFQDVNIIEIPYNPSYITWRGFPSSCGNYVNALATKNNIYLPIYGASTDHEVINIYRENSDKNIVPIDISDICFLGGGIHCLTWNLSSTLAKEIKSKISRSITSLNNTFFNI